MPVVGAVFHLRWCRRHGINPITAEPRDECYRLRGWTQKLGTRGSTAGSEPDTSPSPANHKERRRADERELMGHAWGDGLRFFPCGVPDLVWPYLQADPRSPVPAISWERVSSHRRGGDREE